MPQPDADHRQGLAVKLESLEGTLAMLSGDVVATHFALETLGQLATALEHDLRHQPDLNRLLPVCLTFKEAVAALMPDIRAKKVTRSRMRRIQRLGAMVLVSLRRSLGVESGQPRPRFRAARSLRRTQGPGLASETYCARFK